MHWQWRLSPRIKLRYFIVSWCGVPRANDERVFGFMHISLCSKTRALAAPFASLMICYYILHTACGYKRAIHHVSHPATSNRAHTPPAIAFPRVTSKIPRKRAYLSMYTKSVASNNSLVGLQYYSLLIRLHLLY